MPRRVVYLRSAEGDLEIIGECGVFRQHFGYVSSFYGLIIDEGVIQIETIGCIAQGIRQAFTSLDAPRGDCG